MIWIYAIAVSVAIGIVVGYVAEYVPIPSVWQSVGAALAAMVLGALGASIAAAIVWNVQQPQTGSGGLAAVSFGLDIVRLLMEVAAVCVLAAALHSVLGRMGGLAPALMRHRPMVLSCLGGLCGALPVAWIITEALRGAR